MDYYSSNALSSALKCAFCAEKFVYAVKIIPECGNSICGRCHEKMFETMLKSSEYECKACKTWHSMPANGLSNNQALINILNAKPEQRALPEKAEELKSLMTSVKQELEEFGKLDLVPELNAHCDQLKAKVLKSLQEQTNRLKAEADDKIRQIEKHRRKQLDSLTKGAIVGQPSKRLKKSDSAQVVAECSNQSSKTTNQEFNEISANFERFSNEWSEYFSKLSKVVSEAELEKACDQIRAYACQIQELKKKAKSVVIGEHNMRWKANKKLLKKNNLLGKLHVSLDDDSVTFCQVQDNSRKTSSVKKAKTPSKCISMLKGHLDELRDMVFLSEARLASCSLDGTIKIWQYQDGQELFTLSVPGTSAISLAALSGEKKSCLAAGCLNGWIMIWDLVKRKIVKTLKGHADKVVSVRALPDGNLASMSLKSTIGVWNISSGNLLYSIPCDQIRVLPADLQTLSNGHLVTKSTEKSQQQDTAVFRILNPQTGKLVRSMPTTCEGVVSWLVLSDDRIALGFVDSKIELFDLANSSRKLLAEFPAGQVSSMAQLSGGRLACSLTTIPPVIRILDLNSRTSEDKSISPECDKEQTLYLASSGRVLASTSAQNSIQLWSFDNSN